MADDDEPADDFFVHSAKQIWGLFCAPFRAIANWSVRSSGQRKQQAAARARQLANVRQAAPIKKAESDYTALAVLSGLFRISGCINFLIGVVLLVTMVQSTSAGTNFLIGASFVGSGLVSFAAAEVLAWMIDVVKTLRAIRDK